MNCFTDARDAGRVSHRQIGTCLQRKFGNDFNLPADVHEEGAIGDLQHFDAVDVFNGVNNRVFVFAGEGVDGDVANDVIAAHADDVDRANVAAGFTDRGCYFAECAGPAGQLDAQSQAVTVTG